MIGLLDGRYHERCGTDLVYWSDGCFEYMDESHGRQAWAATVDYHHHRAGYDSELCCQKSEPMKPLKANLHRFGSCNVQ